MNVRMKDLLERLARSEFDEREPRHGEILSPLEIDEEPSAAAPAPQMVIFMTSAPLRRGKWAGFKRVA